MEKSNGFSSFLKGAKNLSKKAYGKSVELGKSAKDKTKQAIHNKKKEIALDVLYDFRENKAKGVEESRTMSKAFGLIENKYANGGGVESTFVYEIGGL